MTPEEYKKIQKVIEENSSTYVKSPLLTEATLEEIMREFDRRGLLYHVTFSAKAVVDEK